jgi:hypothetical protein
MASSHDPRPQLSELRREVAGDLARDHRAASREWPVSPAKLLALMLTIFIGAMLLMETGLPRIRLPVHGARPAEAQPWMRSGGTPAPITDDRKVGNLDDASGIDTDSPPKPAANAIKPGETADAPAAAPSADTPSSAVPADDGAGVD